MPGACPARRWWADALSLWPDSSGPSIEGLSAPSFPESLFPHVRFSRCRRSIWTARSAAPCSAGIFSFGPTQPTTAATAADGSVRERPVEWRHGRARMARAAGGGAGDPNEADEAVDPRLRCDDSDAAREGGQSRPLTRSDHITQSARQFFTCVNPQPIRCARQSRE